jgi:hypothetical protein
VEMVEDVDLDLTRAIEDEDVVDNYVPPQEDELPPEGPVQVEPEDELIPGVDEPIPGVAEPITGVPKQAPTPGVRKSTRVKFQTREPYVPSLTGSKYALAVTQLELWKSNLMWWLQS